MILSVPVIYRFCLTVVFFVVYRLVCCVSSCLWLYSTYFVLNVNNSNYYCFAGFIYFCSKQFFTTFCQKRQKYARHIWDLPLYKKNVPGTFSRLARSRAAIYIFARVRIFSTLMPFMQQGIPRHFLLHKKTADPHINRYGPAVFLIYFYLFFLSLVRK